MPKLEAVALLKNSQMSHDEPVLCVILPFNPDFAQIRTEKTFQVVFVFNNTPHYRACVYTEQVS